MRHLIILTVFSSILAGCQRTSAPLVPVTAAPVAASFDPQEAAFVKKQGSGTIDGHAFLKQKTGSTVNAAGEIVRLIPSTAYARQRFASLYGETKFVPVSSYPKGIATDPQYAQFTRTTKAESNGRFVFNNVAPGSYFITTQVTWQKDGGLFQEGGAVYDTVTLTGKETDPVLVILSGN